MSVAAAIQVRGWCPGALRPMQSGDGLIARVRPWCGAFTPDEARALAEIAGRLGNGHIDLTRRANLQIRGLRDEDVPELQASLARHGLLDRDPRTEAGRNIMVGPLAGIDPAEAFDMRPIARELVRRLASDASLQGLPAKFGFLVDGGGALSIADGRADIALCAVGSQIVVRAGSDLVGTTSPDKAARLAVEAARAFAGVAWDRGRSTPAASTRRLGVLSLGAEKFAVGLAVPFGRLEARQLRALADLTLSSDIRLSPWRALYFEAADAASAVKMANAAHAVGFVIDSADPILRIDACPGGPACRSSTADTRALARHFAAKPFSGEIHISGCSKGCARSVPADFTIVKFCEDFGLVRNGTARDVPERMLTAAEVGALFDV